MSVPPWFLISAADITSTGAGESPTDLASLLEPTATTSSISSADETIEGITGKVKREKEMAKPLIFVLNILFTPNLINILPNAQGVV